MCFGWISLQEPLTQESPSPLQEPPMAHILATAASAVALAFLTWAWREELACTHKTAINVTQSHTFNTPMTF